MGGGPPRLSNLDGDLLDRLVGTDAANRPSWDVLAQLVIRFQQALTSGALSSDTASALKIMMSDKAPSTDNGVFDAMTCERDWPSDLEVYYQQMGLLREQYPAVDNGSHGLELDF